MPGESRRAPEFGSGPGDASGGRWGREECGRRRSEAIKPEPHGSVRDWLDAQAAETLFVSSVTVAELLFGVGMLPKGKRRERLGAAVDGVLEVFEGRILPFDTLAARHYADLAVRARAAGKGFPTPDGYIAAIAASHGLVVASRDVAAFATAGLRVIDPWRESM